MIDEISPIYQEINKDSKNCYKWAQLVDVYLPIYPSFRGRASGSL